MRLGTSHILAAVVICSLLLPGTVAPFCFEEAGRLYGISPLLLWGIAQTESNFDPAAVNWNSNGTYDFGVMQINSSWAPVIGPALWQRLGDACTNVKVGAWVLAGCIGRFGYTWNAVGCYNSASPAKRSLYARRVWRSISVAIRSSEAVNE